MTDLTLLQILPLVLGVAATAIVAGLMAGLLGVGGGIVIVPVLFWILSLTDFPPELAMHMSVATSLATIVFTSVSSARSHFKRGSVDTRLLRIWGPGIVAGALTGGLAAKFIDADGLKLIFGCIALLVALNMASPKTLVLSDDLPKRGWVNAAISYVIGGFSSLMGIGGGTLSVPILSAFSVEIRRAVGTAAAFGFLIAVPAAIGFVISGLGVPDRPPLSLGYISIPAALLILPFTVSFAPVGAALAHRLDGKWIKRAFALFLGITALRMLSAALG
ncbi:sulfite exporter TauE/SafE family protein [Tropicimonas aquimaris]|uniref:Probable membrane transporter protein n=1 Tax=Tropicimonas aquimaris TaxID=914152 RepID=A0ABW3IUU2_9RHOB